jgi:hypothetical protein
MRRKTVFFIGLCCCSAPLAGCSSLSAMTSLSPPVAAYTAASAFSPVGYSQTKIDDTHYQILASGTEATPKERVEKIARVRAAEIGVDEKLKFFKVTSVQHSITCAKRQEGYKTTPTPSSARPSVVLDVVYAKDATDPTFQSSAGALTTLKTDLAAEQVEPEAQAVAIQETRESRGKG